MSCDRYQPWVGILILATCFLVMALTGCHGSFPIDRASALEADDPTLVLCSEGRCQSGYLFFRRTAGVGTDTEIVLNLGAKGLKCKKDSCVRFQVFNPDGSQGYSGSIPQGEDEAIFTLGDVIGSDEVRLTDDHEWLIKAVIHYLDPSHNEREALAFGYIRLTVQAAGYQRLACGDPDIAWRVKLQRNCEAHYSTGMRGGACGGGCD